MSQSTWRCTRCRAGNRARSGWRACARAAQLAARAGEARTGADAALEDFTRKLRAVPACLRKTLTYDQGKEMARPLELTGRTGV
ncbi:MULTISPECIES: hypothetical protein [Methylococcus]|uniref:Transposase n=1 Tax=Methylococcus capsulatus TaxID=414 RepID=A0ABZ2F3E4_METCP|nr:MULTISPECIES: hypothetical protein [Methylococcus]